ncbi:MAG: selenocysteine lyase/cysteine desulfurase [Bacteroidia bacterium]
MQDRRDFLRIGAAGLTGLFVNRVTGGTTGFSEELKIENDRSKTAWEKIETEFSIDKNINYLNNGTMGLSPKVVTEAVYRRMEIVNSTGSYSGMESKALEGLAKLMHCDASEVAITHNVTEGINIAAWALPLQVGDEVILTNHEHVGNALPWLNRKRKDGIEIRMLELPKTGEECLERLKKLVTKRTKVIAVPHVTCTTGQVLPIKEICAFAKSRGIYTLIDGAHGVGMLNLDVKDLGCDMYASCCHKWMLGPKGTGVLYANKALIKEMDALFVGGYSDTGWTISEELSEIDGLRADSHRFFYGTQNSALYAGIAAAADFLLSIGMTRVENRVKELNQQLYERLKASSKIDILTPNETESRAGILSFNIEGNDRLIYEKLRRENWILRFVAESKLNCIRVSTHIYNCEEQIEALTENILSA